MKFRCMQSRYMQSRRTTFVLATLLLLVLAAPLLAATLLKASFSGVDGVERYAALYASVDGSRRVYFSWMNTDALNLTIAESNPAKITASVTATSLKMSGSTLCDSRPVTFSFQVTKVDNQSSLVKLVVKTRAGVPILTRDTLVSGVPFLNP